MYSGYCLAYCKYTGTHRMMLKKEQEKPFHTSTNFVMDTDSWVKWVVEIFQGESKIRESKTERLWGIVGEDEKKNQQQQSKTGDTKVPNIQS